MTTNPELPSYEELFGALNFKKGDDARCVYSPAAYLTDLLELLEDEFTNPKLLDRREDIKEIPLDSEHTYSSIPYLDIVNEVLEKKSGSNVYEEMTTAKYPFNLPFNYENERIKKFLSYLNVTLEELYQSFSNSNDFAHVRESLGISQAEYNNRVVSREYLQLSQEEYDTYTTEITTDAEIKKYYNNESFENLKKVENFLKITGISGEEFRELLYQNLSQGRKDDNNQSNIETIKADELFINDDLNGYAKLDDNEENIIFWSRGSEIAIPLIWYERVNRFIRIAKKIGISFTNLDIILRSCCGNKLDTRAIQKIAVIKQLHDLYELPFDVICSFFSNINIRGVGNEKKPQDLFNRIFNLRFADIDKKYILVSEFIPNLYSTSIYNQLSCSGDMLSSKDKEYRVRLSKALSITEKDLIHIVDKFRSKSPLETPLDIKKDGIGYKQVELSALSLLFRITKLTETLDISSEDLFNLFDILEKEPAIRRHSNFDILVNNKIQEVDCYKIILGNDVNSSLWLIQILFAIVKWIKSNNFTTENLKLLIIGEYKEEVLLDTTKLTQAEIRKQQKIDFINNLYQQFKPTILNAELFNSDLFDNRATRLIHQTLTQADSLLISRQDNRIVKYNQHSAKNLIYQALIKLEVISREDFMYLNLEQNLPDYIYDTLILKDYISTEGKLNEAKLSDTVDDFKIASDFSDYQEELFQLINNLIRDEAKYIYDESEDLENLEIDFQTLDVAIYPSHLEAESFKQLTEEQRQELYDNLIFNGYINQEGKILQPSFFTLEDADSLFAVNNKIAKYSVDIFNVIYSRFQKFQEEKITLEQIIFSNLPLTEAEITDLIGNLQFNEYIDKDNIFLDKEQLLTEDVNEFKLALVFYPYRHQILKALKELIYNSKSGFYVITKESFAEIADTIAAEEVYQSIKTQFLNDDGMMEDEEKYFFLNPDNLAEFTVAPHFTQQDNQVVFNAIAEIINDSQQYQFTTEGLSEWNFDSEEEAELIETLVEEGFLVEGKYIPEDKIDYFLNVNNALEFYIDKFEDYNKDIFFVIHFIAKRINNAIQEIDGKLKEVSQMQKMVLLEVSQEIFSLEKDTLKVIFNRFFRGEDKIIEEFMVPVLAMVNSHDRIAEEPNHNKFNFAYRRIQQFALLVSILRLNQKEVEIILEDQDIVEKLPENLILPEDVNSIDALLESPEGIIYLFKGSKYWVYSAETYNLLEAEDLQNKLRELGYSQTLARRISTNNNLSSLSDYFSDILKIDTALVDKNGKSFIFAAGKSYSKEKNSTRWVLEEEREWGDIESNFEQPKKIDATFQDREGKTYLFFEEQYIRYSNANYDEVDEGYPLEIAGNWKYEGLNANLPEEFHKSIDASFQGTDDKTYLFKDNTYVCSHQPGYQQSINETWGRVKNNFDDVNNIDAAYIDGGKYFLFSGNQVIAYQNSLENDGIIVEQGFPQRIESYYPNLPADFKEGINAALKGEDGKIYLFKDNQVVSLNSRNDAAVTAKAVKEDWGKVPNHIMDNNETQSDIDAAFVGLEGKTYLFSGEHYFRYSGDDYSQVDEGFPRIIEEDWGGLKNVYAAFTLDGKTYLFGRKEPNGNVVYVCYSTNDYTKLDEGFPKEPNDNWWNLPVSLVQEGAVFSNIDAVFNGADDKVYLFSGNKFISCDRKQRWWTEPQDISTYWDSIPFEWIDAAFTGKDGKTYLFSGKEYLRYSGENYNRVEDRYPNITKRYWGNVVNNIAKTGRVDAAVVVTSETPSIGYKLKLVAVGNQLPTTGRAMVALTKVGNEYRIRIFDSNWRQVVNQSFSPDTMLAEKIDAALKRGELSQQEDDELIEKVTLLLDYTLKLTYTYLFSGDQYVRYLGNNYQVSVDEGYPKYIATSLHKEPRFQNLEMPWEGRIDAAFADSRNIYLFKGKKFHVLSEKLYKDYPIENVSCAFLEDSALFALEEDSWKRYSNIEGKNITKTSIEPLVLKDIPAKFKTGLNSVLHGVDNNTYLFKEEDCFNILLEKEYPLNEEWGRVDNNVYVNKSVDAAFVGLDGNTYLFSGEQYVTYSGNNYIKQEIEGYPQNIAEKWGGLNTVALAFVRDDKTYLFEKADEKGNSRYLCYSTEDYSQPDAGYPQVADIDYWQIPNEYSEDIGEIQQVNKDFLQVNAALFENDNMFLVTGKHYLQFNTEKDSWAYPKPLERIWRDIPFQTHIFEKIKTAFTGKDGKTYFFSDEYYVIYDGNNFTQPELIKDDWGLIDNNFVNNGLKNKIDAAFVWQNKITYLFSGDQYVRYSTPDYRYVDEGYPKNIAKSLITEPGFTNLPEEFSYNLATRSNNETDTVIDAIVANNRNIYIFMGNHCHVVSQNLTESYDIDIIGNLKNNIVENNKIDAAFVNIVNGFRSQTFLFSDEQYVRYSPDGYDYGYETYQYVDDGYPKAIANFADNEESIQLRIDDTFKYGIDAAMTGADGNIYLFKGDKYLSSAEDGSRDITSKWGRIKNNFTSQSIDAGFASSDGKMYLFKGDQYIRYTESNQKYVDEGFPKSIKDNWGNLPVYFEQSLDGAFALEGKTYFLKGDEYVRYSDASYQQIDSIYPQKLQDRWGDWADYLLNDIQIITRFKKLQDSYSNGDYTLVDFLHSSSGQIPEPYKMLSDIFDWDIDHLKWLKRNNAFLENSQEAGNFLEDKFNVEIVIKLFDVLEVTKKMGAAPKEVYEQVWKKMYPPGNLEQLKQAADTLYKFLGLVNS